jgi:hypothetical protein
MTESPNPEQTETRLALNLPSEHETGVYASFAQIWHDNDGFIVDFAVPTMPPTQQHDENGKPFVLAPAKVVSRIRMPASQAWEFMRALNAQLTMWEREHGQQDRSGND